MATTPHPQEDANATAAEIQARAAQDRKAQQDAQDTRGVLPKVGD
ncbi:hypothetical protein ACWF94_24885 [Streptomyces sp. NPDC055078]